MIIDGFLFFNEFDVLEWRLHELNDAVDGFVLVESSHTFQGKPKPLLFQEQLRRRRFKPWLSRIEHVVVQDSPEIVPHPMDREIFQRNCIMRGLNGLDDSDVVLISDVDEIPSAGALSRAPMHLSAGFRLGQRLYHDFINLRCQTEPIWYGTHGVPYASLKSGRLTPQTLRMNQQCFAVEGGGWHFSFLGGIERMQEKLSALSHFEWDKPPFNTPENLAAARREGRDWDTNRAMQYRWTEVDETYPVYLREQLAAGRFREHVGLPQEAL